MLRQQKHNKRPLREITRAIPTSHIVANTESGIYKLSGSIKATVRASVVNSLKNSKPEATSNITRQQLAAVRTLQQDPTITVVPADKGKAAVVMDTVEYREKVTTTPRSQTNAGTQHHELKKDLNKLLLEIKSCPSTDEIDSKMYHRLHSTDATRLPSMGSPRNTSLVYQVYHYAQ